MYIYLSVAWCENQNCQRDVLKIRHLRESGEKTDSCSDCITLVMNDCGLLMELYWHRKTEVPGGKNLSQCHFVHHKSHMDCTGIETYAETFSTSQTVRFLQL
jgi:hypothetical protein